MKCYLIQIFITINLALLLSPCSVKAATLQEISVKTCAAKTQTNLRLNESVRYSKHTLPASGSRAERCYIDLYNTRKDNALPSWLTVKSKQLSKIRTGTHASKLRVVFDLRDKYECNVTTQTNPFVIQIAIFDNTPSQTEKEASSKTPTISDNKTKASASTRSQENISEAPKQQIESKSLSPTDMKTSSILISDEADQETLPKPSFWGWIKLYGAKDTQSNPAEDDNFYRSRARLGTDWRSGLTSELPLLFKGSIDIDHIFYDTDRADEKTELSLRETYLQLNGNNWDISFGKQRVRWGKSDQLSPVDTINPQDYRQSLAVDLEERALPSWLLRSRWYGENMTLEAVVQPWFQKSEIDYFDSDWALYRNLRQSILANPAVPQSLKDYTNSLYVAENTPSNTIENMAGAIRLTFQTDQSDFGLSYHYGWETLPTISHLPISDINYNGDPTTDATAILANISPMPPTSSRIDATYKRQQTVGFEWESTILDPFGFRGEIAYIDKAAFLSSDLTTERNAVTHLVTGVDYTSEAEWYFNVQGSWLHLHNSSKHILYFDKDTVSILGEISKPVWRGNLEFSIKYNYIATDQSSFIQPSTTLKYFQNIECEIGAMIYSGDGETLLGSYDQADQVYGIIKVSF